ncbi:DsbA family protein, partial [Escherichia coli]|uniref:DsbA family protein n=1 Tax=Escherichia coli TaxID=562 RepID=UPI00186B6D1E|nr:DsbA family protein [Escherichia coli]
MCELDILHDSLYQFCPELKSMETLSTNLQLARLVGVQGAPATIIGDEMIPGAVSGET